MNPDDVSIEQPSRSGVVAVDYGRPVYFPGNALEAGSLADNIQTAFAEQLHRVEEAQAFRGVLVNQLISNGHPEELSSMTDLELMSYIVGALGGVVRT